MLTTVAVLIVLFGLMVDLARHVRESSADVLTKDLLRRLDEQMRAYLPRNGDRVPSLPLLIPPGPTVPPESVLRTRAALNNEAFVQLLKSQGLMTGKFEDLSIAYYDEAHFRDAWGSPIVFMPADHPAVGMTARGWFFFSAGPDREYLSRADNLYSYEQPLTGEAK